MKSDCEAKNRGTLIQVWLNDEEIETLEGIAKAVGGGLRTREIRWLLANVEVQEAVIRTRGAK